MNNNIICGLVHVVKGYLKVKYCRFRSNINPILILTMGKVGSSSVYESLKKKIGKCNIYHIHFLSKKSIKNSIEYFNSKNICTPYHIAISMAIRKSFANDEMKFISLVREPISRIISDYFQNYKQYHPEVLLKNKDELQSVVLRQISEEINAYNANNNYEVTWFEDEVVKNLNINVYENAFNHSRGYKIYKDEQTKNQKLLIIRLDDLNRVMNESIYEFLGYDDINMIVQNQGKNKEYKQLYEYVINHLKIDENICKNIYSSEYMKYFYNPEEIGSFTSKWTA